LPLTFSITLPESCCTTDQSSMSSLGNACQYTY
jgi:hypothetical protein